MVDLKTRGAWPLLLGSVVAVAFGLLTLRAGGAVLFGDGEARRAAGDYVAFVLWFNFLAGFAYVASGSGLWARRRWAAWIAVGIAGATIVVFALFGLLVAAGGAYEARTVAAMALRSTVWLAIAALAWRFILRR